MASRFVKKSRSASGAVTVQVVTKARGRYTEVVHVGSAHDDASLALLLEQADIVLHEGQPVLVEGGFERVAVRVGDVADWTAPSRPVLDGPGAPRVVAGGARVVGSPSLLLSGVLEAAWRRLGFDQLGDDVFAKLVLARVVEPTSKAGAIGVLADVGLAPPSLRSVWPMLDRCVELDYRGRLASLCLGWSARSGVAGFVMYDVTTLHFEIDQQDGFKRLGKHKDGRKDPQVQVGLLVDPSGFPLEVSVFAGNRAETTTIIPVLEGFKARHGWTDVVVVADAGMLSAGNLAALEEAGFGFIVGSRQSSAPWDLAAHFNAHGDYFADGQIIESSRVMGKGEEALSRRVVWQYSFKRHKRDDKVINEQIERVEKLADGRAPKTTARFAKTTPGRPQVDWEAVERARSLAGLKGYVTNIDKQTMPATLIISAYHDLFQVEASFRMAKSDLGARPFHTGQPDRIQAHTTIVFAALAVSRHLQQLSGISIKQVIKRLRRLRSSTIEINGHTMTIPPKISPADQKLLHNLTPETGD